MMLQIQAERPKDAATRKQAARLSMQGYHVTRHELHDPRLPYCDAPVLVHREIRAGGFDKSLAVTTHRPCRRCEKCLLFRKLQWRDRAMQEIIVAPRTWFLSLTFSPHHLAGVLAEARNEKGSNMNARTDRAAYRHVQKYFKRIRKATKRRFRYLCVYERGSETGRSHYHVLLHEVDGPITKRTLEAQWRSHVGCRLVANARQDASYLTSYATKSFDIRPRASAGYGKGPKAKN